MDRSIVYPGSIPLDTDLLGSNRNTMVALGALLAATLGTSPTIDGLAVTPVGGTLAVSVGPGSVTAFGQVDQSAYGSLPADSADLVVRMGVNTLAVPLPLTPPLAAGSEITYLIQAAFQESDANPVVLPYYNAANPAQPYLGPSNTGVAQPTVRTQRVALLAKPGNAAATGGSAAPAPDSGWIGVATVVLGAGQTAVSAGSIAPYPPARIIPAKLGDLRPGFAKVAVFTVSGSFVVPQGVSRLRVTVIAGGGAGGTHSVLPSGGGGAGGRAMAWLSGLAPGGVIPVTVGGGGLATASAQPGLVQGPSGASSSFGNYVSASGGSGGAGGTAMTTCAGGVGGQGYGGDVQEGGSCGTDAIQVGLRGGDGGGPGGGRGTSGAVQGIFAQGPGGGGGGAGVTQPGGLGVGAPGGNGFNGLVIVEY